MTEIEVAASELLSRLATSLLGGVDVKVKVKGNTPIVAEDEPSPVDQGNLWYNPKSGELHIRI